MLKIFVFGTGNIGKRHIQAISNLNRDFELHCYDIFEASLNSVQDFVNNNNLNIGKLNLHSDINTIIGQIDNSSIVISSSPAKDRVDSLKKIIPKKPTAIIAEKPLTQNIEEYNEVKKLSAQANVPVYLNFIAHAQGFYQRIKKEVEKSKEFSFYTNMPNWGISTVGIHQIELFLWLFNIKDVKLSYSVCNEIYEQKRQGFFDIAGNLILHTPEGNVAVINNFLNGGCSSIQINSNENSLTIYEQNGKLVHANNKEVKVEDLNVKFVSQYINEVINDILSDNKPFLPSIEESLLAHKILFEYLNVINQANLNIT